MCDKKISWNRFTEGHGFGPFESTSFFRHNINTAKQMSHMKCQNLFSMKNNKKTECYLLQFLFLIFYLIISTFIHENRIDIWHISLYMKTNFILDPETHFDFQHPRFDFQHHMVLIHHENIPT